MEKEKKKKSEEKKMGNKKALGLRRQQGCLLQPSPQC